MFLQDSAHWCIISLSVEMWYHGRESRHQSFVWSSRQSFSTHYPHFTATGLSQRVYLYLLSSKEQSRQLAEGQEDIPLSTLQFVFCFSLTDWEDVIHRIRLSMLWCNLLHNVMTQCRYLTNRYLSKPYVQSRGFISLAQFYLKMHITC